MTTAEYNADNPFAVTVRRAFGRKDDKISYVLCHQPKAVARRETASVRHIE
jgi:mRNA interferase MazF